MERRKLPDLPDAVAHLVSRGVYGLHEISGCDEAAYLLTTDSGDRHFLSGTGAVLAKPAACGERQPELVGCVSLDQPDFAIKINNS